ncbi:hypothetical protein T484DRAFT_1782672 [Baffinella frigidus]|nr:hypothetical protein T484DRAFT_1782672 [Cryptophyta sp. CCMP2293]
MCGIFGVLADEGDAVLEEATVAARSRRQSTRGPDATGVSTGAGWALAHERLSIMDPSNAGHGPAELPPPVVV